jgi:tetratricopeptide (TPR) repeat protein
MKYLVHGFFILVLIVGWTKLVIDKQAETDGKKTAREQVEYADDDSILGKTSEEELRQGDKVFNGMLMAFLTAGYIGVVFVVYVLPVIAHKFTHAVYDSGEMVEKDVMHDARALYAQGDYEGAIEAYRAAAKADPNNRMPWVEIAKIQRENLEDPDAAIETLRHVLEHYAWPERDAAFFLFRLAEIYDKDKEDRASAAAILQQVMEQFPETRHSANARHKLHEWGVV